MLSGRHAVVTDFGVAKAVSEATGRHELTTKGVALGTPTYMAPEQAAANEHIDPSESPDNGRNFNLRIHWDPTFEEHVGLRAVGRIDGAQVVGPYGASNPASARITATAPSPSRFGS